MAMAPYVLLYLKPHTKRWQEVRFWTLTGAKNYGAELPKGTRWIAAGERIND